MSGMTLKVSITPEKFLKNIIHRVKVFSIVSVGFFYAFYFFLTSVFGLFIYNLIVSNNLLFYSLLLLIPAGICFFISSYIDKLLVNFTINSNKFGFPKQANIKKIKNISEYKEISNLLVNQANIKVEVIVYEHIREFSDRSSVMQEIIHNYLQKDGCLTNHAAGNLMIMLNALK